MPRCGYRLWKLCICCAPKRPGMPRLVARVEFDYFEAGACRNVAGRLMVDDEHGDVWLADVRGVVPLHVSEAVRDDAVDSLVSMGVLSAP